MNKKQNKITPKTVKLDKEYTPNVPKGKEKDLSKFTCTWPTLWTAIGVLVAIAIGVGTLFNFIMNAKLAPVHKEIDYIKNEISIYEKSREDKVNLQLQVIEQKIEVIKSRK